jgi:CheY-like chemotaxis protein
LSTDLVALILGLVFFGVLLTLGLVVLRGRSSGTVTGTLGAGPLKTSLTITRDVRAQVDAHLEQAAAKTGHPEDVPEARRRLEETRAVRRASVLWVDDHPDNNVEENLMLRDLGLSVTQTLSSGAASRYLDSTRFDLVITDIGRGGDPDAGLHLLEELGTRTEAPPTIVYTLNAGHRKEAAIAVGAEAVVETPAELLAAVLRQVAG